LVEWAIATILAPGRVSQGVRVNQRAVSCSSTALADIGDGVFVRRELGGCEHKTKRGIWGKFICGGRIMLAGESSISFNSFQPTDAR
jgi:hypothetical protein